MINDAKISHFLSLAQTLNFTETARNFHISQQAVSKSIASFEQDLGVQLFVRTRNFVLLTDAGRTWLEFYRDHRERFERQQQLVQSQRESRRKRIDLGYQDYLSLGGIPNAALGRLHRKYPQIELNGEQYSPAVVQERLMRRQLDIVILCRRFLLERQGIKTLALGKIPMMLMVSSMDPRATATAKAEDFCDLPYVVDRFEHESDEDCVSRGWSDVKLAGLTCSNVAVVPNRASAYTTVEMGGGVLLSTAITRSQGSPLLKSYPTALADELICIWRNDGNTEEIEVYAQLLWECYQSNEFQKNI